MKGTTQKVHILSHPLIIDTKAVTLLLFNLTGLISPYVSSRDNSTLTALSPLFTDLRSSGKADLVNIYGQSITIESDDSCVSNGDVNADGVVNVVDVISTVNHIIGNSNLEGSSFCSADLNGDSIINVTDIISLINLILS